MRIVFNTQKVVQNTESKRKNIFKKTSMININGSKLCFT